MTAAPLSGGSPLRALLVDWGGVLTNDMADCTDAFCDAEDIDPAQYRAAVADWFGDDAAPLADNPAQLLERGAMPPADFERALAAKLRRRDGGEVVPEGLLARMFAESRHEPAMVSVVRRARRLGVRTALVSNSWSMDAYDRAEWDELFDAIVISGEIGMRKPDADIYRHTARLLGVRPAECVFVDDLAVNVRGAVRAGMVGVQHASAAATIDELCTLFDLMLRGA